MEAIGLQPASDDTSVRKPTSDDESDRTLTSDDDSDWKPSSDDDSDWEAVGDDDSGWKSVSDSNVTGKLSLIMVVPLLSVSANLRSNHLIHQNSSHFQYQIQEALHL